MVLWTEGIGRVYLFRFELTGIRPVGMGIDEGLLYLEGSDAHRTRQ